MKLRNRRVERSLRRDLLLFFDLLSLYVSVGYDLAYAWQETLSNLKTSVEMKSEHFLSQGEAGGLLEQLWHWEQAFPIARYRFVFSSLAELYSRGGSLSPVIHSFSQFLRMELDRDLVEYLRDCPTRANVLMIIFFLPPTLALLIAPLLRTLLAFQAP